jgi:hypothetical protein
MPCLASKKQVVEEIQTMSEIKYEIIQKIGVLSSPLCPSDISPREASRRGKYDNLIVWLEY